MRATMIDYSTRLWLILAILIINDKFMQTEQILGIISVPNAGIYYRNHVEIFLDRCFDNYAISNSKIFL